MPEDCDLVAKAGQKDDTSADVLYTAEIVYDSGTYTLVVRDMVRGTLQTTTVPRRIVSKMPTYLSMLNLRQY